MTSSTHLPAYDPTSQFANAAARGSARTPISNGSQPAPAPAVLERNRPAQTRPGRPPARGVRRTRYLPPDVADRLDQVVDDLAHELRIPKLDIPGALLGVALDQVDAVRDQLSCRLLPGQ